MLRHEVEGEDGGVGSVDEDPVLPDAAVRETRAVGPGRELGTVQDDRRQRLQRCDHRLVWSFYIGLGGHQHGCCDLGGDHAQSVLRVRLEDGCHSLLVLLEGVAVLLEQLLLVVVRCGHDTPFRGWATAMVRIYHIIDKKSIAYAYLSERTLLRGRAIV